MHYLIGYGLGDGQMLIAESSLINARDCAKHMCLNEVNPDVDSVRIFDAKTLEVIEAYIFNRITGKVERKSLVITELENDKFYTRLFEIDLYCMRVTYDKKYDTTRIVFYSNTLHILAHDEVDGTRNNKDLDYLFNTYVDVELQKRST